LFPSHDRGQVGYSQKRLSERWRWSRTKTRKFLNDLEKEQQIKQLKSHSTTIIELINYKEYQSKEQLSGQQKNNRKTTGRQQEDTNNNDNNENNDNNVNNSVAPAGANDSEQVSESLAIAHRVATNLLDAIKQYDSTHRYHSNLPSLSSWIKDIDRAVRLDKRTEGQLNYVIDYIFKANGRNSAFWAGNIESGKKLREKFDTIKNQIKQESKNYSNEDAIIDSLYAY